MSRVAKNPIQVVAGVEVLIEDGQIAVKGPLGTLTQALTLGISVENIDGYLHISTTNSTRETHAMSGTMRALLSNMVLGVTRGFERKLTLVGVGYRAQAQGEKLNLTLGFSHPVEHMMPVGIKVETPTQTEILIKGMDKQVVGQVAADIRSYRKPEPYKGKGVRYANEIVALKETKKK
ncbi:MAG: 50S ribosomal protein L6 [Pseudomonadota bacterium]|nr:50S ribosomal protein L6 [Pseudomonadota bacterium]